MLKQLLALSPQLIISLAITLMLLLIAAKRSQRMVQIFACTALIMAMILTLNLLSHQTTQVTILLSVSSLGVYAQLLIYISALMVAALSYKFLKHQTEVHDEYYLLILLAVLGASILVVADHFAAVFLGFEILSISLVGLVGYCRESKLSIEAGVKYLVLSAVASSFMLLGIAFIYGQTGALSFQEEITATHVQSPFYVAGIMLFFAGVAFKLALAPFHLWVADVYQGAHSLITLFMATITKVAMVVVFFNVVISFDVFQRETLVNLVLFIAIFSMIVGNVLALMQLNIKRLLAYSSIAHMGYVFVVMVITKASSIEFAQQSALMYLFAYVLATMSLFYVIFQFNYKALNESLTQISDFKGLFWKDRPLAILLLVGLLSLAGIPLTVGFIGKFYLFSHVVMIEEWTLLAGLVIGSGIGLYYYLSLMLQLFSPVDMGVNSRDVKRVSLSHYSLNFVVILIMLSIAFGVYPDVLIQFLSFS